MVSAASWWTLMHRADTRGSVTLGLNRYYDEAERIQKRFKDWAASGITGMTIGGDEQALRLMAEVAGLNVEPDA